MFFMNDCHSVRCRKLPKQPHSFIVSEVAAKKVIMQNAQVTIKANCKAIFLKQLIRMHSPIIISAQTNRIDIESMMMGDTFKLKPIAYSLTLSVV